ncbi:hypothetical protein M9978_04730 [Sphingomonas sp. MG17]|uniref:Uncharacterized protein n=1 Tax=Sphingomonas tagetis TaxID=2949092 RepID=A0A9X2HF48_9SPHN|nr:hypothetical protein [Sphingomonas tagetis]MCP3729728.1 hypothetical protein [Sphingomonas tagetis]
MRKYFIFQRGRVRTKHHLNKTRPVADAITAAWLALLRWAQPEPAIGPLSLKERVERAIASARAQLGVDESLDDVTGPKGGLTYVEDEETAAEQLRIMHNAAIKLRKLRRQPPYADPVEAAAARTFVVPQDLAPDAFLDQALAPVDHFARLVATKAPVEAKRGRGRPATRNPVLRAAVRAAMHQLWIDGQPISGGWRVQRPQRKTGEASRTKDDEFHVSGAAEYVVKATKNAGVQGTLAEIKGHMTEYVTFINERDGEPREEDYIVPDDLLKYHFPNGPSAPL